MTAFIVICAAMVLAALVLIGMPIRKARISLVALCVVIPLLAGGLYWRLGHRTWQQDLAMSEAQTDAQRALAAQVADLDRRLVAEPDNVDVALQLAEVLISQDRSAAYARAEKLTEDALLRAPKHPKALWYGALFALAHENLELARDRLQTLLAQNPPENIRNIIERQIGDLNQQIGAPKVAAAAGPSVTVEVTLDEVLTKLVSPDVPLFILARDPNAQGPPLAVVKRTARELPLTVTLSDADAVMAGRGLGQAPRVTVVARLAKGGSPQAQPGDLYGEAVVDVPNGGAKADLNVKTRIKIDRVVGK